MDPRTGLEASRFGVYVHFPWCGSKCPYCDFASVVSQVVAEEEYADALERELIARVAAWDLTGRELHSLYFGGGTPSLWAPRFVARIVDALAKTFRVGPRVEVTLEANPGAAAAERFAAFRAAGVNRLSMGMQSFQPELLRALGRRHDAATAERAFASAREAGFDNLSLDLIYGVQGQTVAQARADAARAMALQPDHVSAYALTLDRESLAEEVPLAKQVARGEVVLPGDEALIQMQRAVTEVFAGSALGRYEISNFCREGFHSRHNALYWTGGEYLALGAGATGRVASLRYSNHRSPGRYFEDVAAGRLPHATEERLSDDELLSERVAMGLRLCSGVALEEVLADFGRDPAGKRAVVARLLRAGLAEAVDGRLRLTPRGMDVHSSVAVALL